MCSEFWSGWFDKWGANHETRPAADMIAGIDEMFVQRHLLQPLHDPRRDQLGTLGRSQLTRISPLT